MKIHEAIEHAIGLNSLDGKKRAVYQDGKEWVVCLLNDAPKSRHTFNIDKLDLYIETGKLTENYEIPHGNIGNQNAVKGDTKEGLLRVRCYSRQKSGYVKTAQRKGMKLSEWVLQTLDKASDY